MARKKLAFDKYVIIQEDLDHCIKAVRKLGNLMSVSQNILEYQKKVTDVINIPNWLDEHKRIPVTKIEELRELRIHNIRFYYTPDNRLSPPALDFEGKQ